MNLNSDHLKGVAMPGSLRWRISLLETCHGVQNWDRLLVDSCCDGVNVERLFIQVINHCFYQYLNNMFTHSYHFHIYSSIVSMRRIWSHELYRFFVSTIDGNHLCELPRHVELVSSMPLEFPALRKYIHLLELMKPYHNYCNVGCVQGKLSAFLPWWSTS